MHASFSLDATLCDAQVAARQAREEAMIASRDAKLAERDTKKWCLERCLATGYCDAVEDILDMSTSQVHSPSAP